MNVFDRIAEWAEELPDWQSDAVRRILLQGHLTDSDQQEILHILKVTYGIQNTDSPAPTPRPLQRSDLPTRLDSAQAVILEAMHSIQHVNALAPNQTLTFGPEGLTVIYGDNASGKSGYSRVLKRACRARGEIEEILPNVFSGTGVLPLPEAVFAVSVGSVDKQERWIDKRASPDSLTSIAVFDSKSARFYVDERNEVVYVPYGLDVFTKLGKLCTDLRAILQRELGQPEILPKDVTDLQPATAAGQLVHSLTHSTDPRDVEKIGTLTEDESTRLDELRRLVAEFDAKSPAVIAANYRHLKNRILKLQEKVLTLDRDLSTEKCNSLKSLYVHFRQTSEAARLASEIAFKDQPLPGVGLEPWRDMFESARRYSETLAYVGQSFPVTVAGSRCVLCQQLLVGEARLRLDSFENFVKQDTERHAKAAKEAWDQAWQKFNQLDLHPGSSDSEVIEEINDVDSECRKILDEYLSSARVLSDTIRAFYEKDDRQGIPSLSPSPASRMRTIAEQLESKAKEYDAVVQPEEQKLLRKELSELVARKSLFAQKSTVLRHLKNLLYQHRIGQCINATNTLEISLQGKKIMDEVVTETLKEALEKELAALGVKGINLVLSQEVRSGTTFHYLKLQSGNFGHVSVSDVLSEGEQRAVAIASFLSEVLASSHLSGIVFDDPVSSLDHKWRHRVARRLVEEGRKRQVIIFTHDIVFVLAIEDEAARQKVPLLSHTLHVGPSGAGTCDPANLPWDVMNTKKRIGYLRDLWQGAEKKYRQKEFEAYRKAARECYDLLRQSWERAVEEVLLNKVVERFGSEIKTQSLRGVTVTDEDFVRIDFAMSKCSEAVHDMAPAINKPPRDPDELSSDIEELSSFVDEINHCRGKIEEARRRLQNPPHN